MILFFTIVTVIGPTIILVGLIVLAARDGHAELRTSNSKAGKLRTLDSKS
jgi:hypothetical protein